MKASEVLLDDIRSWYFNEVYFLKGDYQSLQATRSARASTGLFVNNVEFIQPTYIHIHSHGLCFPLQNNSRIIYDQRQTGKYNIQISIKDVAIVEVDKNEFVDDTINDADEYYYDDDDLTIKPIFTWMTSTTTTVQTSPLISTSTKEPIDSQLATNKEGVNELSPPHISTANVAVLNSSLNLTLHSSLSPSSANSSIASDIPLRLVMKPVALDNKANQVIPQSHAAKRNRQDTSSVTHVVPDKFRSEKEINTTILKIITAQPLSTKRLVNCKDNYVIDSIGNCRKKKRSSFLKSFFDMLKLMRIKEI